MKNRLLAISIAICSIVAAGGILASNMGFKINYPLLKASPGVSRSGTSILALPYVRKTGLKSAWDLLVDIEGHGPPLSKTVSIGRFLEEVDSMNVYTGRMGSPGANFLLVPGEGYRVQMSVDVSYVIVGVHDPSIAVRLDAAGDGSRTGTNDFAPPYNATARTAFELMQDIEGGSAPPFTKVVSIARYLRASDSLQVYIGRMGSPGADFALIPGESYRVQMAVSVPYVASHY